MRLCPPVVIVLTALLVASPPSTAGQAQSHIGASGSKKPSFTSQYVEQLAQNLAKKPYTPPRQAEERWADLSYDQYRDVRVRREAIVWRGRRGKFELHLL